MKSTLKNMILSLLVITLVAALAVGLAYQVTKEPIAIAKANKSIDALADVLPEFDNDPLSDSTTIVVTNVPIKVYEAHRGASIVGYAVETQTTIGYNGLIKMMVGFNTDGEIINIKVLEHNETPGLGSKMTQPKNPLLVSFVGKNPADLKMSVTVDGGDIDIITASTITSRAYTQAVERAYEAFEAVAYGAMPEGTDWEALFDRLLPNHQNNPTDNKEVVEIDGVELTAYKGLIDGEISGYAVEGYSKQGYGGEIRLFVGFKHNGEVTAISVTEHSETPGFGSEIENENNLLEQYFIGKKIDEINTVIVKKGGDIDVLSSATITTEGYVDAVKRAHKAFLKIGGGE